MCDLQDVYDQPGWGGSAWSVWSAHLERDGVCNTIYIISTYLSVGWHDDLQELCDLHLSICSI